MDTFKGGKGENGKINFEDTVIIRVEDDSGLNKPGNSRGYKNANLLDIVRWGHWDLLTDWIWAR